MVSKRWEIEEVSSMTTVDQAGEFSWLCVSGAVESRQSPAVSLLSEDDAGGPRGPRAPGIDCRVCSVSSGYSAEYSPAHLQKEAS